MEKMSRNFYAKNQVAYDIIDEVTCKILSMNIRKQIPQKVRLRMRIIAPNQYSDNNEMLVELSITKNTNVS